MTTTAGSRMRNLLAHAAGTLLAIALLPLCLAIGVPWEAWAIGAGAVVANRLVHGTVVWSVRDSSITVALGAMGFSMIFRAFFTALVLFFVGASIAGATGDQRIGLDRPDLAKPAILIFMLCFTVDAAIEAIRRAGERFDDLVVEPVPAQETA